MTENLSATTNQQSRAWAMFLLIVTSCGSILALMAGCILSYDAGYTNTSNWPGVAMLLTGCCLFVVVVTGKLDLPPPWTEK